MLQHRRMAINPSLSCQRPVYLGPFGSSNIFSVSSGVLPEVSGNIKKTWMNIAPLEDTENEIYVPLYVYEGGKGNEPESEVERPVNRSHESNSFPSKTKGNSSGG